MKKLLIACVFVLSACDETNSVSNETKQASISVEPPSASVPKIECEGTKPTSDLIMDVIGDGHLLYTLPNDKAPAVVNSKTSEISGKTEYHQIDTSTQVKIHCDKGEWVFVQLTMPEWLTHVKGWTKKEYLKHWEKPIGEPTKALDSKLSLNDLSGISTSNGLTKADLAWHAINTYGFDCTEVTEKSEARSDGSFLITCSSGIKLTVYLRNGQHPLINESHKTESGDIATTDKQEIILPEVAQKNVANLESNTSKNWWETEGTSGFWYNSTGKKCIRVSNLFKVISKIGSIESSTYQDNQDNIVIVKLNKPDEFNISSYSYARTLAACEVIKNKNAINVTETQQIQIPENHKESTQNDIPMQELQSKLHTNYTQEEIDAEEQRILDLIAHEKE